MLAGFLGTSVLLTLMPGPDILFVVGLSAAGSKRDGVAVALGLCSGLLVHITAAALGISAVVYSLPWALHLVKAAGALYLLYLAWLCWKPSDGSGDGGNGAEGGEAVERSFGRLYRRGIWMNVLNPKVSLFFVAFLPSFVVSEGESVPLQMLTLGLVFLLQALVVFTLVAVLANRIGSRFLQSGGMRRWASRVEGALYASLAAWLLLGG
ncbi:LysE family translocator [Cohnella faecalis]|uniref:LysE family translocator n=2 Tax=Cohnella faecalis TaxID=2315694 RepID=A0A398CMX4_9BACL|nr:LysE family translocator [Cohnella faecalis]